MTIDELKTYVLTMLNAAFPTATIQFERISDDPFHIGVAVFGVQTDAVKWVKTKILDIDEKLCAGTEFAITPLVRDEATTEKFYPAFVSPWKSLHAQTSGVILSDLTARIEVADLETVLRGNSAPWEQSEPLCSSAANEELALAA